MVNYSSWTRFSGPQDRSLSSEVSAEPGYDRIGWECSLPTMIRSSLRSPHLAAEGNRWQTADDDTDGRDHRSASYGHRGGRMTCRLFAGSRFVNSGFLYHILAEGLAPHSHGSDIPLETETGFL